MIVGMGNLKNLNDDNDIRIRMIKEEKEQNFPYHSYRYIVLSLYRWINSILSVHDLNFVS